MQEKIREYTGIPSGFKKIEFAKMVIWIFLGAILFAYGSSEENVYSIIVGVVIMICVIVLAFVLSIRIKNKVVIYTDKVVVIAASESAGNGMTINVSFAYNMITSVETMKSGGVLFKQEKLKITDINGKEYIFYIVNPDEVKKTIEKQKNL